MNLTHALTLICAVLLLDMCACLPKPTRKKCKLLEIPLQSSFDQKKFQGNWYVTAKTQIGGNALLAYFIELNDIQIKYKLNSKMEFDIKAVGSKFRGTWCPWGQGHAAVPSPAEPERMTMYFDTIIGRSIGMKPTWLLTTDYYNYAVLYSCWKETPHGTCEPGKAYGIILQRASKALSPAKKAEVDQTFRNACVDPKSLTLVNHYGYCPPKDEESL